MTVDGFFSPKPAGCFLLPTFSFLLPTSLSVVKRLFFILILFLIAAGAGLYIDWNWKRPLWPRGGRYFFHRVELPVPSFRQSDERWSDDPLGGRRNIKKKDG